ncbi:unnamed protein product [Haemonchus placei]|uniref:DUF2267 domain-containing protein n=1 Tax=Haemonchus placei TaxID=6290 RepID=A0A0N4W2U5_HAEPC|nr:unnamed protein product [Haemonchus placei]
MSKSSGSEATQQVESNQDSSADSLDVDYGRLSVISQLVRVVLEHNTDPLIERILLVLAEKISKDAAEFVEADSWSKSVVISGVEKAAPGHPEYF